MKSILGVNVSYENLVLLRYEAVSFESPYKRVDRHRVAVMTYACLLRAKASNQKSIPV